MPWMAAAAVVGSQIVGSVLSANAAGDAADQQRAATEEGIREQGRQYDISRKDSAPWRDVGSQSITRIGDLLGLKGGSGDLNRQFTVDDFWRDPVVKLGYQSGLDLGVRGINNMAGARGMRNSGATLKELMQFGQDYTGRNANDAYTRFYSDQDRTFNRLAGASGVGQTATNSTAMLGANTANNIGNLLTADANARGAAGIAQANAYGNAANTIGGYWQQNNLLNKYLAGRNGTPPASTSFPSDIGE